VACWAAPATVPRVQLTVASPVPFVAALAADTLPPPAVTAKATFTFCTGAPPPSVTWTLSTVGSVLPTVLICPSPPVFVMNDGTWATVTGTSFVREPECAVIVAVPFPCDVACPCALTMTTAEELVDHVTLWPGIESPFWSSTFAASCLVLTSEPKLSVAGVTTMEVGIGASVLLEHALATNARTTRRTIRRRTVILCSTIRRGRSIMPPGCRGGKFHHGRRAAAAR